MTGIQTPAGTPAAVIATQATGATPQIGSLTWNLPTNLGGNMCLALDLLSPFGERAKDMYISDFPSQNRFDQTQDNPTSALIQQYHLADAPVAQLMRDHFQAELLEFRKQPPTFRIGSYLSNDLNRVDYGGMVRAGLLTHSAASEYLKSVQDAVNIVAETIPRTEAKIYHLYESRSARSLFWPSAILGGIGLGSAGSIINLGGTTDLPLVLHIAGAALAIAGAVLARRSFRAIETNFSDANELSLDAEKYHRAVLSISTSIQTLVGSEQVNP